SRPITAWKIGCAGSSSGERDAKPSSSSASGRWSSAFASLTGGVRACSDTCELMLLRTSGRRPIERDRKNLVEPMQCTTATTEPRQQDLQAGGRAQRMRCGYGDTHGGLLFEMGAREHVPEGAGERLAESLVAGELLHRLVGAGDAHRGQLAREIELVHADDAG